VRGSYRPVGGSWQVPVDISADGEDAQSLQLALDAQGDALVAWGGSTNTLAGYERVKVSYRPKGGSWGESADLSEDGGNAFPQDLAFDQQGNAVVVWQRPDGSDDIVQAAYRPADGGWQEATSLSEPGQKSFDPVVVLDAEGEATAAQGDATAVWTSGEGEGCGERPKCSDPTTYTVQAAGYDPDQAQSEEFEAPAAGIVGTPVAFSAARSDVWSPLLEFGDGASATSTSASHTYTQPGRYLVTFTSTEVLGYRVSRREAITIGAAGSSPEAVSPIRRPASAKSPTLKVKLSLARQTLHAILHEKSVKVICHVNAPGACTVRGPVSFHRASLKVAGQTTVTVGLTHNELKALRHAHGFRLTLTATADTTDHRTAKTTIALLVR
jgi:hypothetical protein